MKCTYLMDIDGIKNELERLWNEYQEILNKPSWEKLNEARSILYLVGNVYCENIAPEAIERRLHLLEKTMTLDKFLLLVDTRSAKLIKLRKDPIFKNLEKFYLLVKNFKNKFVGGNYYLDEERFIELYNKYNPENNLKINYRGEFGE